MTKLDAAAEMMLELAHGAREPSAADKARNLAAVRARLGLVPPEAGAGTQVELEPVVRRSPWPRLLVAGVATGVVGFWMGLNVGRTNAERDLSVAAAQPGMAASSGVPAPSQPTPPAAIAEASAPEELAVVKEAADEEGVRTGARPRNAIKERAARAPSKASGPDFLDAVRLLRRAQRALRMGDAAVGSSLLDQLDERFPPDVLQEERQATRVLGLCASGEPERAEALARELLQHNPRSIYARRMHQSCVGGALALALPAPVAAPRR